MADARIGTMGWSYGHWVGNFYPEGTGPADYLSEYSRHFGSVEIDGTFYRIPYKSTVDRWRQQTPDGFEFAAKFPKAITHGKKLGDEPEKLEIFIENISRLGEKLGPLLLQFPPKFRVEGFEALKDFLQTLPENRLYAVELRHRSWLEEKVYGMLRDMGVALVLVDHPRMPMIDVVTSNFTYIRWQGERREIMGDTGRVEKDRSEEIKGWAVKILGLLKRKTKVYGYFSKFYSGHPPTDAKMLIERLSI
jgi:uncharacterized protein YecE (DUF72 family)